MSLKREVLVLAGLLLTLPSTALADGINLGFSGGTIDASGFTLTTTSGTGTSSTLNSVSQFPSGTPTASGTLGTVDFDTGLFLGGCGPSGTDSCYAAAGSSILIVATSAFATGINPGDVLFTGTFVDIATALFAGGPLPPGPYLPGTGAVFSAAIPCNPPQPAGVTCYQLYGTISGTLNPALVAWLGLPGGGGAGWIAQIDLQFSPTGGLTLSIHRGDAQLIVPEPGTLALFGTGLLGLAGLLRRKLLA